MPSTKTKQPTKIKPIKTTKENALDRTTDDPIEAKKWRPIAFLNDGKSHRGLNTYNSEAECQPSIDNLHQAKSSMSFMNVLSLDGTFKISDFNYAIAMPEAGNL